MSEMNPHGIELDVAGETRCILFSLAAIDEVQDRYESSIFDVLGKMYEGDEQYKIAAELLKILLDDEAEREKILHPESEEKKKFALDQIKRILNVDNIDAVRRAILKACRVSVREEEEDDDPNRKRATEE